MNSQNEAWLTSRRESLTSALPHLSRVTPFLALLRRMRLLTWRRARRGSCKISPLAQADDLCTISSRSNDIQLQVEKRSVRLYDNEVAEEYP